MISSHPERDRVGESPLSELPEHFPVVAIVGVGLLGGSIGMALQACTPCADVIGVGRDESQLAHAMACNAVTRTTTDLAAGVADADLIVVSTPVGHVAAIVHEAYLAAKPSAIITDVASTKARIVGRLQGPLASGMRYIGSHPLAGSHLSGVSAASPELFRQRTVIVTPPNRLQDSQRMQCDTERICEFWRGLGASAITMTPIQHDEVVASTSHVPHVVAAALAAATPDEFLDHAASGWRDTTRVAAGSIEIWQEILVENRVEILRSLDKFGQVLDSFRTALESADLGQIAKLLEHGKHQRDAVGN